MTLYIISKATYYCEAGEGVVVSADVCKSKAEAAKFIKDDYSLDDEDFEMDWPPLKISAAQIKDGAEFRSPAFDDAHDTIWHVTEVNV